MLKKNSGNEVPLECEGEEPVAVPVTAASELNSVIQQLQNGTAFVTDFKQRQEKQYPLPTPLKGTAAKAMADAIRQLLTSAIAK